MPSIKARIKVALCALALGAGVLSANNLKFKINLETSDDASNPGTLIHVTFKTDNPVTITDVVVNRGHSCSVGDASWSTKFAIANAEDTIHILTSSKDWEKDSYTKKQVEAKRKELATLQKRYKLMMANHTKFWARGEFGQQLDFFARGCDVEQIMEITIKTFKHGSVTYTTSD
ncbi:hypothetical protein [Helicobacter felis]|uniref:hypothetical protein n=1 Tax=Helicobacter felis TaxID=214 RepID=UPI000CEEF8C2|nr:hypothetical protein [Helicobacter felis]